MSEKRLRVVHVIVKPVLVWDNGEELTAGPEVEASALPLSALAQYAEKLPADLEVTEQHLLKQEFVNKNVESI
jgi:hypothetical protein